VALSPTAVQVRGATQETELMIFFWSGRAVGCIAHLLPFHVSASARSGKARGGADVPTAVQLAAPVHEIPYRAVSPAPAGSGTSWIVQVLPSQRSASGDSATALLTDDPAAVQAVAEVQETADNRNSSPPAGAGTGWNTQVLPFQVSANGVGSALPRATH
jgi:hypothetical protein